MASLPPPGAGAGAGVAEASTMSSLPSGPGLRPMVSFDLGGSSVMPSSGIGAAADAHTSSAFPSGSEPSSAAWPTSAEPPQLYTHPDGTQRLRLLLCSWCKQYRDMRLHAVRSTDEAGGGDGTSVAARDVFQCVGCLHFAVACRLCHRGLARRGTPTAGRLNEMTPVPSVCSHDPPPRTPADVEAGVWEDPVCGLCDGSFVQEVAGVLGPRLCSGCISCTYHTWRRERPGWGLGTSVAVGGRKGTVLGLGTRSTIGIGTGIDAYQSIQGSGTWGGAPHPEDVDVDGSGDCYTCGACGTETVKCRTCDVGMAVSTDGVEAVGGHVDPLTKGLCASCNGYMEKDEEYQRLLGVARRGPAVMNVYIEPANPTRRDVARLLHNLFPDKMGVTPPEARVPVWEEEVEEEEDLETAVARELADIEREEAVKRFMGEKAYEAKKRKEREEARRLAEAKAARLPSVIATERAREMGAAGQLSGVQFMPRTVPWAVYVPHPVKPRTVQVLLTDFHTYIASEKAHELTSLVQALGGKRMREHIVCRKDSLDLSSSDEEGSGDGKAGDSDASDGEDAAAARRAAAMTTEGLLARWKAHRLTTGAGANSTSAMEQQRRRAALMTVDRRFPLPSPGWQPTVPYDLMWLPLEATWLELADDRIMNSVSKGYAEVAVMKSYGVDAGVNDILQSPLLMPLQLSMGLVTPTGPPPKQLPPVLAGTGPPVDDEDADAVAAEAAAKARAQAVVAARGKFVGRFMPKSVRHEVWFHPDPRPPPSQRRKAKPSVDALAKSRVRAWREGGSKQGPDMWYLLKHPHL